MGGKARATSSGLLASAASKRSLKPFAAWFLVPMLSRYNDAAGQRGDMRRRQVAAT
jgi:glycerol-3-phosphate acyltransferase PlsY